MAPDYEMPEHRRAVHELTIGDVLRQGLECSSTSSLRDAVRQMRSAGASAIAVVDASGVLEGVVSESDVPGWIAGGGVELDGPVSAMLRSAPVLVESDAKLSEVVVPMLDADAVGVRSVGRFAGLVTTGGRRELLSPLLPALTLQRIWSGLRRCCWNAGMLRTEL